MPRARQVSCCLLTASGERWSLHWEAVTVDVIPSYRSSDGVGSSWGNRPAAQKYLQVSSERVAARAPWGQWQVRLIRPGSLPCQPPLAGLAQNPFSAVIAGAIANQLGLTLKGQLIGHLGVRGSIIYASLS